MSLWLNVFVLRTFASPDLHMIIWFMWSRTVQYPGTWQLMAIPHITQRYIRPIELNNELKPGTLISYALHTIVMQEKAFSYVILFSSSPKISGGDDKLWEINIALRGKLQLHDQQTLEKAPQHPHTSSLVIRYTVTVSLFSIWRQLVLTLIGLDILIYYPWCNLDFASQAQIQISLGVLYTRSKEI